MNAFVWIVVGATAWLLLGVLVGYTTGAVIRNRDRRG